MVVEGMSIALAPPWLPIGMCIGIRFGICIGMVAGAVLAAADGDGVAFVAGVGPWDGAADIPGIGAIVRCGAGEGIDIPGIGCIWAEAGAREPTSREQMAKTKQKRNT